MVKNSTQKYLKITAVILNFKKKYTFKTIGKDQNRSNSAPYLLQDNRLHKI